MSMVMAPAVTAWMPSIPPKTVLPANGAMALFVPILIAPLPLVAKTP